MPEFASFADFIASGMQDSLTEVTISGVVYRQRDSQPLHSDFRYQDGQGRWWSPDYHVVVTGGQSNMVGAGSGAAQQTSPNVMGFNPETGAVEVWSYPNTRNNLYIPYAVDLSQSLGRPVLVIEGAVSGSRIDSWLESNSGVNWLALDQQVKAALAGIGQTHVDNFLWLQGEGDYPLATSTYVDLLTAFIGQVRGSDWAGDAMALLIGELSREGVNSTQNQALQQMELAMSGDGLLRFVSSVGLTAFDTGGVHFDGASLVEYGQRFFAALQDILAGNPVPADTAPYLDLKPDAPVSIVLHEGEELHLSADLFFSDAEGDALWLYGALGRRTPYFLDGDNGDLVLRPGFDAKGDHTLFVYASDGQLDSQRYAISLTVLDALPGASIMTNTFDKTLSTWSDAEEAMSWITKSRGLDILRSAAMPSDHALVVTQENLFIRGGADVQGQIALSAPILRLTLAGQAAFDALGNSLANTLTGNAGTNRLEGGDGNDRCYGGAGADFLTGDNGNDQLYGDDDGDHLSGGLGDDRLTGGLGGDRLEGLGGKNQYYGGDGSDVFVFSLGEGVCGLRDFTAADDLIEVSGRAGIDSLAEFLAASKVQAFTTSQSFGVKLTIGGDQLMIYNTTLADLTDESFRFI